MKLTEISTIKALCQEYGFGFKKKFGQNFLVNPRVPAMIAEAAEGTCALEIGPGIGTMTRELSEICPKVVAIEIDTSLQPLLETTLSDLENVEVVFESFRPVTAEVDEVKLTLALSNLIFLNSTLSYISIKNR